MNRLDDKLNRFFGGKVVRKDLTKLVKGNAIVPTYVLEYLLGQYCATDDEETIEKGVQTVRDVIAKHFVHRDEAQLIKSTIRERGSHRIIDKVSVKLNDKKDIYEATFANLGLKKVETQTEIIKRHQKLLSSGVWCIVTMEYVPTEERDCSPWKIDNLKPIQISNVDVDDYKTLRKNFTKDEWLNILMQSIGLNPEKFSFRAKLIQLSRLVPFAENNYNLIELGPKGTGKSHIYSEMSPHGILISGGEVSKAKLFVNNSTGEIGLLGYWDVVTYDEFAGKSKKADKGLVDIMKNYMANKSFSRGTQIYGASASLALIGNTDKSVAYMMTHTDLFEALPKEYYDSAFLDRIHSYLPGWEVQKLRNEMFTENYGFIVDYLAEVLKEMRKEDRTQEHNKFFDLSDSITTRDKDSIAKTFSGLLKVIYPHGECSPEEAKELIDFAIECRKRVKLQLIKMDETFESVDFSYSDKLKNEAFSIKTLEEEQYPDIATKINEDDTSEETDDAENAPEDTIPDQTELVKKIIAEGEGKSIEFKSSLRWDYDQKKLNREREYDVLKTIAAFANTAGGSLIIGIKDSGEILGIGKDYKTLGKKQTADGFLLHIDNTTSRSLGKIVTTCFKAEILLVGDKHVCKVDVNTSPSPVFINENDFYIRSSASSRLLNNKETNDYIKQHW